MGVGKHGAKRGADFWELLWLNFEDFGDRIKNFCLDSWVGIWVVIGLKLSHFGLDCTMLSKLENEIWGVYIWSIGVVCVITAWKWEIIFWSIVRLLMLYGCFSPSTLTTSHTPAPIIRFLLINWLDLDMAFTNCTLIFDFQLSLMPFD